MGVKKSEKECFKDLERRSGELGNRSQKAIPRKRSWRSGCIWTEVRANGRQPGGAEARLEPRGARSLRSVPQPGRDGSASELRKPCGRRGPQGPGASHPKQGGATASGALSGPSLTLGRLETPKARSVRVVAELPPLTRPLAAAPFALAPSAGSP